MSLSSSSCVESILFKIVPWYFPSWLILWHTLVTVSWLCVHYSVLSATSCTASYAHAMHTVVCCNIPTCLHSSNICAKDILAYIILMCSKSHVELIVNQYLLGSQFAHGSCICFTCVIYLAIASYIFMTSVLDNLLSDIITLKSLLEL